MSQSDKPDFSLKHSSNMENENHINTSVPLINHDDKKSKSIDGEQITQEFTMSPGPKDLRKFKGSSWRWLMLALACSYLIGSYFCYDNPGVIQTQIMKEFNID